MCILITAPRRLKGVGPAAPGRSGKHLRFREDYTTLDYTAPTTEDSSLFFLNIMTSPPTICPSFATIKYSETAFTPPNYSV